MAKKKDKKRNVTAVAATVAAVATAAGVTVASTFDTPAQLLPEAMSGPPAWSDRITTQAEEVAPAAEDDEEEDEEKKKKAGLKAGLQQGMLSLPLPVRLLLLLPLWLLGSGLLYLGGLGLQLLGPTAGKLLGFLLTAALLAALFFLGVKLAFPDLPLKKILNKKTLPVLGLAAVGIFLLDLILAAVWEDYDRYRALWQILVLLLPAAALSLGFIRRRLRHQRAAELAAPEPEPVPDEPETLTFIDQGGTFTIQVPKG